MWNTGPSLLFFFILRLLVLLGGIVLVQVDAKIVHDIVHEVLVYINIFGGWLLFFVFFRCFLGRFLSLASSIWLIRHF
jgi:hypothetical protein